MGKSYYDFMAEISSEELYDKLVEYGMFSEKLPPVLTTKSFLHYCKTQRSQSFEKTWYGYSTYENIRNINIPRNLGIPTPMGHELLCKCLSKNWDKLIEYFRIKTLDQTRTISRIHIRKMKNNPALFEMNYKNWSTDGTLEPDIYLGKKYMVHADIAKCYPSIYTHAIPWALVGKEEAKKNTNKGDKWYNTIDCFARCSKHGETHGLLIGPHTSNILSEIILCAIDEKLSEKYECYLRNIDDYVCYTETREEAEQFIIDLSRQLREFDLLLNHKKTEITELPICVVETWLHKIQNQTASFQKNKNWVDYREIQAYLDFTIKLVTENADNNAILFYAIKTIKGYTLTKNAKDYLVKSVVSLSLLYPYLVPLLDEYIFQPYQVDKDEKGRYAGLIFRRYMPKNNFEACSYAILYAINSNCILDRFNLEFITNSKDCILLLMALIYCRKNNLDANIKKLKCFAKELVYNGEMDQFWLFTYEALGYEDLKDAWVHMKKSGVTFLKSDYYN